MVSFSVSYWLMDCTKWCDMPFKWNLQVIYRTATALLMILIPGICVFLLWALLIYPGEGGGQKMAPPNLLGFVLATVYIPRLILIIHITSSWLYSSTRRPKRKKKPTKSSFARKSQKFLDKYNYVRIEDGWRAHSPHYQNVLSLKQAKRMKFSIQNFSCLFFLHFERQPVLQMYWCTRGTRVYQEVDLCMEDWNEEQREIKKQLNKKGNSNNSIV